MKKAKLMFLDAEKAIDNLNSTSLFKVLKDENFVKKIHKMGKFDLYLTG